MGIIFKSYQRSHQSSWNKTIRSEITNFSKPHFKIKKIKNENSINLRKNTNYLLEIRSTKAIP